MLTRRNLPRTILAVLSCVVLAGCGGGGSAPGSATGTGRAVFTIIWPDRSKLIPAASNSIKVSLAGPNYSSSKIVPRPTQGNETTVTFDQVPAGEFTATAVAYPNADGTGVPQAQASVPVSIHGGQPTPVNITMNSTIDHMEIAPANPIVFVGQTMPLIATAKDSAGMAVLTWPKKIQWSSHDSTVSINAAGMLTGLSEGTAHVSVTESESGKSATVAVTVTVPGLAATPWPKFHADPPNSGRGVGQGAIGQLKWMVTPFRPIFVSSPAIGEDGTIFAGGTREFYAFDPATGAQKWVLGGTSNTNYGPSPLVGKGSVVYINSLHGFTGAIDTRTGEIRWLATNLPNDTGYASPAIAADGTVYIASDAHIVALNGATGREKWRFPLGSYFSSPAVGPDGTVYFAATDGRVYALSASDGSVKWSVLLQSLSSPAISSNGTLYIAADGGLHALDSATGNEKWAFLGQSGISVLYSTPAIATNGTVYFGSEDSNLYAIDGATGVEKWHFQTGGSITSSPAIAADNTVYISSQDGKLYAVNGVTGAKNWEFKLGDPMVNSAPSSPVIGSDGTIYIGYGSLFAIK